jgi:hypothetical protein
MTKLRVVFVHLNTEFPKHLIANCYRMKRLFPDIDLHLIHNTEAALPNELGITIHKVDISRYELDFKNHKWSVEFRSGFWQSSLLRILVLEQFHELFPMDSILHVESDVILMSDFPFDRISQLDLPYWNSFGNEADVAALIYSPTIVHTKLLVASLRNAVKLNHDLTDMTALNFVRKENPKIFKLFPTSYLDESFNTIPFIFDGAILGMWLFGQDPRNHYGFQPRFLNLDESHYNIFKGTIFLNNAGVLTLREKSNVSQIVSLHLHCKDTRLFEIDSALFKRRIRSASKKIHMVLFRPGVFLNLAIGAVRGNDLKGFFYNFPLLGRLLRMIRGTARATKRALRS